MDLTTSSVITHEMLQRMEDKILKNRPQLKAIKEKYGEMSYFSYVKQKNRTNPHKQFQDRKKEIVDVIASETTRLLGTGVAAEVARQLKKNDSVSTAEHTAPIGTAHMLSSALHSAIPLFDNPDPRFKNLIILSCSGVSFNNDLSFSRGYEFHLFKNQEVIDSQIAFFGRAIDPVTVLFAPPYGIDAVEEIEKRLDVQHKEGKMSDDIRLKIGTILSDIYSSPHALSAGDYVDQLAITNYYFWKTLFPEFKPAQIPNYIMLSQEKILLKVLLDYHLDTETPLHKFLFDPLYHTLIEKYFDGITGAFNKAAGTGSFLFWGLSKENYRLQLFKDGNTLTSKDGSFKVNLTPQEIRMAIAEKRLVPGLLLTFVTLSFYYGLLLGGGASQPTYLTLMKKAYQKMMEEVGDMESVADSEEVVTDDFVFFRPHLSFIEAVNERISASGMDMYLYQNPENWKKIIASTKTITIAEFITILLPILYKQFCPEEEREEELMNISRQDVERFTGFDKKLPVLGSMS